MNYRKEMLVETKT